MDIEHPDVAKEVLAAGDEFAQAGKAFINPVKQGVQKVGQAIHLARVYSECKRNLAGQSFWARWYFVSTVGRDEELIRN